MADHLPWASIRAVSERWARTTFSPQLADPDLVVGTLRRLERREVAELVAASQVGHLPAHEASLALALALLGPPGADEPPETLWNALRDIACSQLLKADHEHCVELVLAWGCGWRRAVAPTADTWAGEWEPAVLGLCGLTLASVRESLRLLSGILRAQARTALSRAVADSRGHQRNGEAIGSAGSLAAAGEPGLYAAHIALELLQPAPGPTSGSRLDRWEPKRTMLRGFVAEAVRGLASSTIKGEAFKQSLLFPLLRADLGLQVDQVRFVVCHGEQCNGLRIRQAREQGVGLQLTGIERGLYEGSACPDCGTLASEGKSYYVARRNRLLIPQQPGGAYELREVWRCTHCGSLFPYSTPYKQVSARVEILEAEVARLRAVPRDPEDGSQSARLLKRVRQALREQRRAQADVRSQIHCPLCLHPDPPQRPMEVWVYSPNRQLRLSGSELEIGD